jgi:hypothetical protein
MQKEIKSSTDIKANGIKLSLCTYNGSEDVNKVTEFLLVDVVMVKPRCEESDLVLK